MRSDTWHVLQQERTGPNIFQMLEDTMDNDPSILPVLEALQVALRGEGLARNKSIKQARWIGRMLARRKDVFVQIVWCEI